MGKPRTKILVVTGTAALLELAASPASAHAFGTRYDLPLPLTLYLIGAGAAVTLSFVVMARFLKHRGEAEEALRFDLLSIPGIGWLGASVTLNAVRSLSVAVFVLLLAAGFFGNPDPFRNIAPTFVWVVWWVGMAFTSALVGNLWALVNPWKILFTWFERATVGFGPILSYPAWLGRWPVVVLFLDMGKAVLAVVVARIFFDSPGVDAAAALAVVFGHNWPVFIRFKGGKGIASGWGGLFVLSPIAGLVATLVGLPLIAFTRYVSLASISSAVLGSLALIILAALGHLPLAYIWFGAIGSVLVVVRHRENIQRLLSGTERKLGQQSEAVS